MRAARILPVRPSVVAVRTMVADVAVTPTAPAQAGSRRKLCDRCKRPASVCLCPALPPAPIQLQGKVIILQHPGELKRALATVPLLRLCIQPCEVVVGRKFKPGQVPDLQHIPAWAPRAQQQQQQQQQQEQRQGQPGQQQGQQQQQPPPATWSGPLYCLFPGQGASPVDEVAASAAHQEALACKALRVEAAGSPCPPQHQHLQQQQQQQHQQQDGQQEGEEQQEEQQQHAPHTSQPAALQPGQPQPGPAVQQQSSTADCILPLGSQHAPPSTPAYLLLVVDGTWKEAKEMFSVIKQACMPPHGPCIQVTLPKPTNHSASAPTPCPDQAPSPPLVAAAEGTELKGAGCPCTATSDPVAAASRQQPVDPAPSPTNAQATGAAARGGPASDQVTTAETVAEGAAAVTAAAAAAGCGGSHAGQPLPGGPSAVSTVAGTPAAACSSSAGTGAVGVANFLLRKEPEEGFMLTFEAVARAVSVLEGGGSGMLAQLLAPLELMTRHQMRFDPSVRDRMAGKREADSEWVQQRVQQQQQKRQQKATCERPVQLDSAM
ncbi:hypothetical protein QJQ45_015521 [Haematococcus lacustris]|nr:hypothetical protein QJQ45_015521 [Haematococcus lacustris]